MNIPEVGQRPLRDLYRLQTEPDGYWSWNAHFILPGFPPKEHVLGQIHNSIQSLNALDADKEKLASMGLSGVVIEDDDNPEAATEVIFASDPSQKFGDWHDGDKDQHAAKLAERNDWIEARDVEDTEYGTVALEGCVRVIMGLNKDLYDGADAFTLEEVISLMPQGFDLQVTGGGTLFSGRPIFPELYKEPAAIIEAYLYPEGPGSEAEVTQALANLAYRLNYQHRWVLETEFGPKVYRRIEPVGTIE